MRVLNLVPNPKSRFFKQQVEILTHRGIDCTTVSVPGNRKETDDNSSSRSIIDYLRFYPKVLASLGPHDLVHANYGLTAPAAIAQPTRPVVISLWGSDLMGTFGPMSQWCARRANAVIVMSEEMASILDSDCYVIPHGVNLRRFQPAPQDEARHRVGWRQEGIHILFPYPAQREVKDYPRAKRVVGMAQEHIDTDIDLHTLYGVPHKRMPDYMNAANALLLTSKREGSPNSVKEALACNLPIVSTDVGDVRERLNTLELSFVCQTDDELVDGLVKVSQTNRRSNGRQEAKKVSLKRMGERIEVVYNSVLGLESTDSKYRRPVVASDY